MKAKINLKRLLTYLLGGLGLLLSLPLLWKLLNSMKRQSENSMSDSAGLLYNALVKAGFFPQTAKYITAQAAHETGNFTSSLFLRYNNPFGMKQPLQRETTSLGGVGLLDYASYSDIDAAAKDFRLWWLAREMPERYDSLEAYIYKLNDKDYFEDNVYAYLDQTRKFYNQLFG